MTIKYYYIGDTSKARTNVITVAYDLEDEYEGIRPLRFGVSFSNKADVYNKHIGKQVAMSRYLNQPRRECLVAPDWNDIQKTIISNITKNEAPTWAYDVAESSRFV